MWNRAMKRHTFNFNFFNFNLWKIVKRHTYSTFSQNRYFKGDNIMHLQNREREKTLDYIL